MRCSPEVAQKPVRHTSNKKIEAREGVPGVVVANRMVGVRIRQVLSGEVTADSCWIPQEK